MELRRFCWSELDTITRRLVGQSLNLDLDSLNRDFELCIYIDIEGKMRGEVGKTYNLNIALEDGRRITSSTKIPRIIPIDSAQFIKPPGENQNDTLAQMRAWANDPRGPDYYRYFTAINGSAYTAGRNSVADDAFFDGINTKFNLLRSVPRGETVDQPELFGLWRRGDSISIKFCTIDENSFGFWNTLEQSANRGGPFANYLKTKHNVVGGLGGWCGYGVSYFNARVPKLKK
ncbi:MAG: DUF4249 family protein [Saprospiraceae bacterium]|nr:DUF4249 family protein [Saprospiraceae bacterium]